jgi:cell wall-associated NlpC family hydrolase
MLAAEIFPQRAAVVRVAKSWEGTPFHHNGAVKGAGCDCSHLGLSYSEALGVTIEWPKGYDANPQWFLNADPASGDFKEIYLEGLLKNGFIELSDGQANFEPFDPDAWIDARKAPGDVAIARLGRLYAHAAIIEEWPYVIQAEPSVNGRGKVCRATAEASWFLTSRDVKFFSWKAWHV